jgi:S-methylmethionine-dependent homocysteine/selenocysteine methylase
LGRPARRVPARRPLRAAELGLRGIAPEALADAAEGWIDSGSRLVGGCCGTRPEHIRAIRERVDGRAAAVSG